MNKACPIEPVSCPEASRTAQEQVRAAVQSLGTFPGVTFGVGTDHGEVVIFAYGITKKALKSLPPLQNGYRIVRVVTGKVRPA